MTEEDLLKALAASGQLGYGVLEPAFRAGLERRPDFIGADMGSVDPGPEPGEDDVDAPLPEQDLTDFEGEAEGDEDDDVEKVVEKVVELSQKEQNAKSLAIRRAIEKRREQRELDHDLDPLDLGSDEY